MNTLTGLTYYSALHMLDHLFAEIVFVPVCAMEKDSVHECFDWLFQASHSGSLTCKNFENESGKITNIIETNLICLCQTWLL